MLRSILSEIGKTVLQMRYKLLKLTDDGMKLIDFNQQNDQQLMTVTVYYYIDTKRISIAHLQHSALLLLRSNANRSPSSR